MSGSDRGRAGGRRIQRPEALGAAVAAMASLSLLSSIALAAQEPAAGADGVIPFEMYELENGLTVILAPDPQATAVAVNLWYDVGSRHERPGRSGFAHLFEHLMFQGSENVERGQHMELVQRAGGDLNASITEDRTNYFQTLPPDRMNLALWLESERMRSLVVTRENMEREVEVVKEERRLGVDNSPYGSSVLQAQYYAPYDSTGCFAYAHSVIGSMEDLDAAELEDVQEFFDTYYVPGNATLTVVGNFDEGVARELIEEYFGPVPGGPNPPGPTCEDPFGHLPVSMEVEDPNATLPAYIVTYGTVPANHDDAPALQLAATILGTGQASRLHQRLVRDERAAANVQVLPSFRRGPGVLVIVGIVNQGVEPEAVKEILDEEMARLAEVGATEEELERALNRRRANAILGRQTVMGRAEALQHFNHFHGTPEALAGDLDRYARVTLDDIHRVARTYLIPDNRVEIITRPGTGSEDDR